MGNKGSSKKSLHEDDVDTSIPPMTKILVLGCHCSGKSKFQRGVRVAFGEYDEFDRKLFLPCIRSNWNQYLLTLLEKEEFQIAQSDQMLDFLLSNQSDDLKKEEVEFILPFVIGFSEMLRVTGEVDNLWKYDEIPFGLIENMGNLSRFNEENYIPTDDDILSFYLRTTGISEFNFTLWDEKFTVVDVGGARSERKKWIHCFEALQIVVYFVNLGEYNQVLYEDDTTNRLQESFTVFKEICSCKWLTDVKMVVLFDNEELFRKKIEKIPMTDFRDFKGVGYEKSLQFIESTFQKEALNYYDSQRFVSITTTLKHKQDYENVFLKVVGSNIGPPNIKCAKRGDKK